jgi:hypothetical protein
MRYLLLEDLILMSFQHRTMKSGGDRSYGDLDTSEKGHNWRGEGMVSRGEEASKYSPLRAGLISRSPCRAL